MEIEAKQQAMRASKRSVHGPYIQYRSTTMPLNQVRKPYLTRQQKTCNSVIEPNLNKDQADSTT